MLRRRSLGELKGCVWRHLACFHRLHKGRQREGRCLSCTRFDIQPDQKDDGDEQPEEHVQEAVPDTNRLRQGRDDQGPDPAAALVRDFVQSHELALLALGDEGAEQGTGEALHGRHEEAENGPQQQRFPAKVQAEAVGEKAHQAVQGQGQQAEEGDDDGSLGSPVVALDQPQHAHVPCCCRERHEEEEDGDAQTAGQAAPRHF